MADPCFRKFFQLINYVVTPNALNDPFSEITPEICKIAATELQQFLTENDAEWIHNFGITETKSGNAKGKMVGVLVVKNHLGDLGYLSAFSGKLADENLPERFVPSVFDVSTDNYFINRGMSELTHLNKQLKRLESSTDSADLDDAAQLKKFRKIKSASLQKQLFENYKFLNASGESQTINQIFENFSDRNPPSAAGECAAPKLLNYAYQHNLKPVAVAEFWWGQSPESEQRIHKHFYPACNDKCLPILRYMMEK